MTPFLPPKSIVRALRSGLYPSFDEIDTKQLDAYLAANRDDIITNMGLVRANKLFAAAETYAQAQAEWHSTERRWASKSLRFAFQLVDVPSWIRGIRRLTQGSEQMAESFTSAGIATWQAEGRLSATEAEQLQKSLALPEVASATANLGAHMAMSVPLRFPLGSIARSGWTAVMRIKGEWNGLRGKGSASSARQVHSLPVMVVGAVPGLGAFAYTLARPLRQQRALGAIALDQSLRHISMRAYRGLHFDSLTLWMAQAPATVAKASRLEHLRPPRRSALLPCGTRLARWRRSPSRRRPVAAVMSFDARNTQFNVTDAELVRFGLLSSLFLAGFAGLFAFRGYWQSSSHRPDLNDAAGMFLWGAGGFTLIGLGVDYTFGVHHAVAAFTSEYMNVLPIVTDPSEHLSRWATS